MNGAKIVSGALVTFFLAACSAAPAPSEEASAETSPMTVAPAAGNVSAQSWGHPVCKDKNPSCTSTLRLPNTSDPIEAQLAHLCFFPPFDWHEWNADSDHIYETFFLCPDTAQLHAYVDSIDWGTAHTISNACGVCIPSTPPGFTYVVTNRHEAIPSCGEACQGPAVSVW